MKNCVVVAYDIVDDRRRRKIQKILEGHGRRVQYSVFECWLDKSQYRKLKKRLEKKLKEQEDSIRYYKLCTQCAKLVEVTGQGNIPKLSNDPWLF